jgi:predicted DNA-binding transcriptional regulator AlpA
MSRGESEVAKKPKRLLSREQILDRVPLSYPTILKRIDDEENPFPAPRMIGSRPFWVEDEIDDYITNLPPRDAT